MATSPLTVATIDRSTHKRTPTPIKRLATGFGPVIALYVLYSIVRYLVADRGPIIGFTNARRLLDLEKYFGIDWEHGFQTAFLPHEWIVKFANWYYVAGFLPVLIGSAILAAWRAPDVLRHWRVVFAVSLGLALVGYSAFPLAPPRLLPEHWGFVDTLLLYGPRYYGDATGSSVFNGYGILPSTVNVYAAMPSMHVAWSAIAGILFAASLNGRRWPVVLAIVHPALMAFAVVVTANHYLLDIVAGLVVLAAAIAIVRAFKQRTEGRDNDIATVSLPGQTP